MKNNNVKISRILNSYGLDHYVSTHDGYGTRRDPAMFCFTFEDIDKKLGASEKDKYRTRIIGVLNSIGLVAEEYGCLTYVYEYVGVRIELASI